MTSFTYREPDCLARGKELYEKWELAQKGNVVSILGNGMTVLRQLGPAGLELWINCNPDERQFIRSQFDNALFRQPKEVDEAWSDVEDLMTVLRYAKYYAKTQEKE